LSRGAYLANGFPGAKMDMSKSFVVENGVKVESKN